MADYPDKRTEYVRDTRYVETPAESSGSMWFIIGGIVVALGVLFAIFYSYDDGVETVPASDVTIENTAPAAPPAADPVAPAAPADQAAPPAADQAAPPADATAPEAAPAAPVTEPAPAAPAAGGN